MKTKVVKFTVLVFVLALLVAGFEYIITSGRGAQGNDIILKFVFRTIFMFTPLLSVLIIERFNFKKILAENKFVFPKYKVKVFIKFIVLTAVGIPFFIIFLSYILGNLFALQGFPELIIDNSLIDEQLLKVLPSGFLSFPNRLVYGFLLLTVASTFSGLTINMLFSFGEEIGWRGLLENNMKESYVKKSILIGIIWGFWHAPIIILGHNYGADWYGGIPVMIGFCIACSFLFSNALICSESIILPAVLHGIINGFMMTLNADFIITSGNPIMGPVGIVGILSVSIVALILKESEKIMFKKTY